MPGKDETVEVTAQYAQYGVRCGNVIQTKAEKSPYLKIDAMTPWAKAQAGL